MNSENEQKIKELLNSAPENIKLIILGKEIEKAVGDISLKYKVHIDNLEHLIEITKLTILGNIQPEDLVSEIESKLAIPDFLAVLIVAELDKTIFQKARVRILGDEYFGAPGNEIKKITIGDTENSEPLREQIKKETSPEKTINKPPLITHTSPVVKPEPILGSHQQLIEQLQILQAIPTTEDVEERLNDIKQKIEKINNDQEDRVTLTEEAKQILTQVGETVVEPEQKVASYSKAPDHYNVDPYRETAEK